MYGALLIVQWCALSFPSLTYRLMVDGCSSKRRAVSLYEYRPSGSNSGFVALILRGCFLGLFLSVEDLIKVYLSALHALHELDRLTDERVGIPIAKH